MTSTDFYLGIPGSFPEIPSSPLSSDDRLELQPISPDGLRIYSQSEPPPSLPSQVFLAPLPHAPHRMSSAAGPFQFSPSFPAPFYNNDIPAQYVQMNANVNPPPFIRVPHRIPVAGPSSRPYTNTTPAPPAEHPQIPIGARPIPLRATPSPLHHDHQRHPRPYGNPVSVNPFPRPNSRLLAGRRSVHSPSHRQDFRPALSPHPRPGAPPPLLYPIPQFPHNQFIPHLDPIPEPHVLHPRFPVQHAQPPFPPPYYQQHNDFIPQQQQNLNYQYPIAHPVLPTSRTVKLELPPLTNTPLLNSTADWTKWLDLVVNAIDGMSLYGHIRDPPSSPDAFISPANAPTYPPLINHESSPEEIAAYESWWRRDNLVSQVLSTRLGAVAFSTLPRKRDLNGNPSRTARDILVALRKRFGVGTHGAAQTLKDRFRTRVSTTSDLPQYIADWRTAISQLEDSFWAFTETEFATWFADGLPADVKYQSIRHDVRVGMDSSPPYSFDPEHLFDEAMAIRDDIIRHAEVVRQRTPRGRVGLQPAAAAVAPNVPNGTTAPAAPRAPRPTCATCGTIGHTTANCWGTDPAARDRYLAAHPNARAHIATEQLPELATPDANADTVHITSEPVSVSSQIELIDMCVGVPPELSSPVSFSAGTHYLDFINNNEPVVLASLSSRFNAILDSGCTTHIFRDRKLFWTYNTALATPVGTANCGVLRTLARGEVRFKVVVDGRPLIIRMRDCLHAPDVPINLLSVGAMTERDMKVVFEKQITSVLFPKSMPALVGSAFTATVHHRLSFLNCDFVEPPLDLPPLPINAGPVAIAMPATTLPLNRSPSTSFPHVTLTPELWHRRFGHVGIDATRAVLTKQYATGIQYDGPFTHTHCIPCLIGKHPQRPYDHFGRRADYVCELLHMDTCGPFPVLTPHGESLFYSILDDAANYGNTDLLARKNDAAASYFPVEARWEHQSGNTVKTVRSDGAGEFVDGELGRHFRSRGIIHQVVAPYAHSQNGKMERYIRTLEETALTLLADSGLPMSFWGDAVLTAQYLRNRLPTSTLPTTITPFEAMTKNKPDLSHLRVWGCQCFVLHPAETRPKGSPKRFEAIFVGYEEDRIGWRVRDLNGKYSFSRDIVFNENVRGRLSHSSACPDPSLASSSSSQTTNPPSPRPQRTIIPTPLGHDWSAAIRQRDEHLAQLRTNRTTRSGGVHPQQTLAAITDFVSLLTANDLALSPSDDFLSQEVDAIMDHKALIAHPDPLHFRLPRTHDLTKPPDNYAQAMSRPDADVWRAAMQREYASLQERGVFQPTTLPKGRKAIGVRWVFDYKLNPDGSIIRGKEKARLVAQGFNQRPEDYGNTYAPVAKMTSIRMVLAYAALHDLELMCCDVKTAFLNALLSHEVYCKQIPGFPEADPALVYLVLRALYGLKQSSFEWYSLLRSVLEGIGLVRCEVDHAVFYGRFSSSPDASIPMPTDGSDLVIILPVHVDDCLGATNSLPLYLWVLREMNKHFEVIDLGAASLYLGIRITRDRSVRKLWLSQRHFITELLTTYNLLNAHPSPVPLRQKLLPSTPSPPNSLPDIADADIKIHFQRLVGSILYLALCTRPDIAYTAMALGQFNSNPTRAHLLAAKGVLRYLLGTIDYALEYNFSQAPVGPPLSVLIPNNCAMMDADWASDESDRRSISGYVFFLFSALVSWSATKQRTTALSSTEAEYMAMSHAIREALWIRLLLISLGFPIPCPFPLLCDNQSAIEIANSESLSSRSKHIDVRYHFIRQHLLSGSFATSWIPTSDMTADILTKPLAPALHLKHVLALGLVRLP
ncbi:Retrovirus-related Pol polyprotein from transposon TNT 1-94 [Hypsizygus marmoreus]|uniref:Retrovirus-related Pol polyprotein from transposon TNT 1-94 n=1 Tax=Hypsizygus marmoreus TaxID=39966 RepID=A0A369J1U1_HYPMA|nr:Retrovirus-related Pol polyprotein from transposon TNT 1-94 [Hypsizygus marmoreus]